MWWGNKFTSTERNVFCHSVSNITEERMDGLSWHFQNRSGMVKELIWNIVGMLRITRHYFFILSGEFEPVSNITEEWIKRFSWNFLNSSDMVQGQGGGPWGGRQSHKEQSGGGGRGGVVNHTKNNRGGGGGGSVSASNITENGWTNFDKIFRTGRLWQKEQSATQHFGDYAFNPLDPGFFLSCPGNSCLLAILQTTGEIDFHKIFSIV